DAVPVTNTVSLHPCRRQVALQSFGEVDRKSVERIGDGSQLPAALSGELEQARAEAGFQEGPRSPEALRGGAVAADEHEQRSFRSLGHGVLSTQEEGRSASFDGAPS